MKTRLFVVGVLLVSMALSLHASAAAQSPEDVEALLSKAQTQGSVRVIVGLRVAFQSEGKLSPRAAEAQRHAISQAQDALLNQMATHSAWSVKKFTYIPYMAMEVDAAGLASLSSSPNVISIEEDVPIPPALSESVPLIGGTNAWASGYTGSGQVVAILDTGVDKTHPFLSGKVVSEACYSTTSATDSSTSVCPGGVGESAAPGSGVNCNSSISGCDHGTYVAGIAAGKGTSFSGVAKDANIIAIQVFSRIDDASICFPYPYCVGSYESDQIKGLERVYALRSSYSIAAANMSLGVGRYYSYCDSNFPSMKASIDNLRSAGIATVVASGNDGYTNSLSGPACISSAISVGSTQDGSEGTTTDAASGFSNSASFLNLLAPGEWINSSVPGGGYANSRGTSAAAPHVAGAWAVLKQKSPSATVDQILSALTTTGQPVTDSRNGITKPRIRVDAALNALPAPAVQKVYLPLVVKNYSPGSPPTPTPTSTPMPSPLFGSVLHLDGDDDYAVTADSPDLDIGDQAGESLTVEAWVNFQRYYRAGIVYKPDAYFLYGDRDTSGARCVGFEVWEVPGTPHGFLHCSNPGPSYGWHHVAGVFNKGTGEMRLYLDGQNFGGPTYSPTINNSTESLRVGRGYWIEGDTLKGAVEEVRISDVARYTGPFTPPTSPFTCDAHTRALWHFDEAAGATTFFDGNDGAGSSCGSAENTLTGLNGAVTGP
jgi:subtilisin